MIRGAMKVAARAQVPPFEVMTVLRKVSELRATGRDVISLCAGEPASGAPSGVRRRGAEVVTDGTPLGYSNALGLTELREELSGHYRRSYGLDVPIDNIAITTGSSGAFLLSFLTAFEAGARVALARPGYPAYQNILTALDLDVVELDCGPAERFQPTVAQLAQAHAATPLAGLVVASPANPTGTMFAPGQLAEIATWCAAEGVRLVSDEIYHGITFSDSDPSTADGEASDEETTDGEAPGNAEQVWGGDCAWATDRSGFVVSSFSKFWGMTGWRLGWALVPDDLIDTLEALAGNLALCPPVPAQHAAVEAFTEQSYAEGRAAMADYAEARTVVLDRLDELGWVDVAPADGAFYVYARITPVLGEHADSRAWADALLAAEGVAVTPGVDFDRVHGDQTIRISLAAGREAVAEALTRILRFQSGLSADGEMDRGERSITEPTVS
ncbi:MAG: aminotransferase class I/II-fold pyridoxal phosphate-dependent enzyme [Propionibacteriaceae bacterium]|nr:aminotransferase class I/II-fold pyridoxal phosphate-dependent enzyme [Propionibacteriaceae bacterium]